LRQAAASCDERGDGCTAPPVTMTFSLAEQPRVRHGASNKMLLKPSVPKQGQQARRPAPIKRRILLDRCANVSDAEVAVHMSRDAKCSATHRRRDGRHHHGRRHLDLRLHSLRRRHFTRLSSMCAVPQHRITKHSPLHCVANDAIFSSEPFVCTLAELRPRTHLHTQPVHHEPPSALSRLTSARPTSSACGAMRHVRLGVVRGTGRSVGACTMGPTALGVARAAAHDTHTLHRNARRRITSPRRGAHSACTRHCVPSVPSVRTDGVGRCVHCRSPPPRPLRSRAPQGAHSARSRPPTPFSAQCPH
jgi:hypothetical protein